MQGDDTTGPDSMGLLDVTKADCTFHRLHDQTLSKLVHCMFCVCVCVCVCMSVIAKMESETEREEAGLGHKD